MITNNFDKKLLEAAKNIKVVFFDVDGVFTDGGLYFSAEGETLKRFNSTDGLGLRFLKVYTDIEIVVITGRDSLPLRTRLLGLGIENSTFSCLTKLEAAQSWLDKLNLTWQQAVAVGDDWIDLPILTKVKLSCAPSNSHPEVLARANYITKKVGGNGCVREVCDLLLQAKGCYATVLGSYLTE